MNVKVTANPLSVSLGLKTVTKAPRPVAKNMTKKMIKAAKGKAQLIPRVPPKPAKPAKKAEPAYTVDKNRPTKNGKTRPSTGTTGGKMWASLDKWRKQHKNKTPSLEDAKKLGKAMKLNETSIVIAYYRWRKFNGIKGRQ